jgi:hypothetical protein
VAKDYVKAYKWLLLAAGQGDRDAKEITSALERMMSRDQTAEGEKLARNFKPRIIRLLRARADVTAISPLFATLLPCNLQLGFRAAGRDDLGLPGIAKPRTSLLPCSPTTLQHGFKGLKATGVSCFASFEGFRG